GDPTMGSSRYQGSQPDSVFYQVAQQLKAAGISTINGNIVDKNKGFDINPIPANWTWGDMGNYYGAGHWSLNWNENAYDILFQSPDEEGTATSIRSIDPSATVDIGHIH